MSLVSDEWSLVDEFCRAAALLGSGAALGSFLSIESCDGIRRIIDPYFAGHRDEAAAAYERWLPLINYENRQCGLIACKALMKDGGVIKHETVRLPLQPLHPAVRAGLIEIANRLDPLVLRWGKQ